MSGFVYRFCVVTMLMYAVDIEPTPVAVVVLYCVALIANVAQFVADAPAPPPEDHPEERGPGRTWADMAGDGGDNYFHREFRMEHRP